MARGRQLQRRALADVSNTGGSGTSSGLQGKGDASSGAHGGADASRRHACNPEPAEPAAGVRTRPFNADAAPCGEAEAVVTHHSAHERHRKRERASSGEGEGGKAAKRRGSGASSAPQGAAGLSRGNSEESVVERVAEAARPVAAWQQQPPPAAAPTAALHEAHLRRQLHALLEVDDGLAVAAPAPVEQAAKKPEQLSASAAAVTHAVGLGHAMLMVERDNLLPFGAKGGRRHTERRVPPLSYLSPPGEGGFGAHMRAAGVEYAQKMAMTLRLGDEALHLCIRFTDRFLELYGADVFLSHQSSSARPEGTNPDNNILPRKLQRLLATSMFVATKVAEPDEVVRHPQGLPGANHFALYAPAFQRREVVQAERALLRVLEFDLLLSTAVVFLDAYIHVHALALRCAGGGAERAASKLDGGVPTAGGGAATATHAHEQGRPTVARVVVGADAFPPKEPCGKRFAYFVSDLLLAEGEALGVPHSQLAAAALVVACNAVGVPSWTPALECFTGMRRSALQPHVGVAVRCLRTAAMRRNGAAGMQLLLCDHKFEDVSKAIGWWSEAKFNALSA